MRRILAIALATLALATPATAGQAWTSDDRLDAVLSTFAMRHVSTRCYPVAEPDSPWGHGAWGYVRKPLAMAGYAALDSRLCAGALDVNGTLPAWQRALGVVVLVHEAYHLRRWGAAGSEAKVECKAIRHWKVGARLLGASEATVAELWPAALAAHYELADYVDWNSERPYYDPTCDVPPLVDLEE